MSMASSLRRTALLGAGLLLACGWAVSGCAQKDDTTQQAAADTQKPAATAQRPEFFLVVHGGAGTITRADMTPAQEKAYRDKMTEAITAGYDVLKKGGSSLDAVVATITILEDSPLFNAGKGAVFTNTGTNELDSSIMNGKTLAAGSVAGVKHVKNPITLARLVMEKSPHVMMVGDGAELFAKSQGMAMVPQSYFYTERRWKELQEDKAEEKETGKPVIGFVENPAPMHVASAEEKLMYNDGDKHGTVGAVALDRNGDLAAGTSTGGLGNKRWGRVGDSPIIGAGTYANNESCAVSATGDGEYFIRAVASKSICDRVQFLHEPLEQAGKTVLEKIKTLGGTGGVIILDRDGHFATPFTTEGMYRGWVGPDGKVTVEIYRD